MFKIILKLVWLSQTWLLGAAWSPASVGITKVCPWGEVPRVCLDVSVLEMCVQGVLVHVNTSDPRYPLFYAYIDKYIYINIYIPWAESHRSLHHACIHPHTYTHRGCVSGDILK